MVSRKTTGFFDMTDEGIHMNKPLTAKERAAHVAQMNANAAIDNIKPDADDMANQAAYVAGTLSTGDMIEIAKKAAASAVQMQNKKR